MDFSGSTDKLCNILTHQTHPSSITIETFVRNVSQGWTSNTLSCAKWILAGFAIPWFLCPPPKKKWFPPAGGEGNMIRMHRGGWVKLIFQYSWWVSWLSAISIRQKTWWAPICASKKNAEKCLLMHYLIYMAKFPASVKNSADGI